MILNHALAKSAGMAALVDLLVAEGERVILQVHDFPEDGRPAALAMAEAWAGCWPGGVHYAVLNHRDQSILHAAGVPDHCLHWLPNKVSPPPAAPPYRPQEAHYPVRGMPRKNLREFLYWASVAPPGWRFSLSGAAEDAEVIALAREARLPVEWNTGYRSTALAMTTSVREGFGFSFLEPWLHGVPVFGRDLPWLTADFRALGIDFPDLYPALLFDGVDFPALPEAMQAAIIRERRPCAIPFPTFPNVPPQNARCIAEHFGAASHERRFQQMMECVCDTPAPQWRMDRASIRSAFNKVGPSARARME